MMLTTSALAETAALVGDPARAGMLMALMDGRALTAGELARAAGVTPQTASGHLAKMATAGLLSTQRQGRHHYHRLASPAVAHMIESIMEVSASEREKAGRAVVTGPRDKAMRAARTCWDHLAGELGVRLADALVAHAHLELSPEGGAMTDAGAEFFQNFGLDLEPLPRSGGGTVGNGAGRGRAFCRPCLDWSERRLHVGGSLGRALADRCFALNWIRRCDGSRAVSITPAGQRGFRETFGI
jgi:DNA-binding transcriptional ArsR family regulator